MKPLFHCEFNYQHSPHCAQIFKGLFLLEEKGVISCTVHRLGKNESLGHPTLLINDKIKVIFDLIDGYSDHLPKGKEKIESFQNEIESYQADFYFKRSFLPEFQKDYPNGCQVLPLGLNYYVDDGKRFSKGNIVEDLKDEIRRIKVLRTLFKAERNSFPYEFYEQYPIMHSPSKIIFLARLWNPENINIPHMKEERQTINENRIRAIELCRKEFGDLFIGGIDSNTYTKKHFKEYIIPYSMTNKETYINTMKSCNICIATTGLNDSIGWKFGEYVAASRCIITEPLVYEVPGHFEEGKNFLSFDTPEKLVEHIQYLQDHPHKALAMMISNCEYYNNYVRPDQLVLNALLEVYKRTRL